MIQLRNLNRLSSRFAIAIVSVAIGVSFLFIAPASATWTASWTLGDQSACGGVGYVILMVSGAPANASGAVGSYPPYIFFTDSNGNYNGNLGDSCNCRTLGSTSPDVSVNGANPDIISTVVPRCNSTGQSVGGTVVAIDKLSLLAPYLGVGVFIAGAISLGGLYVHRTKNKTDKTVEADSSS